MSALRAGLLGWVLLASGAVAGAQSPVPAAQPGARSDYDIEYIGAPLADPVIQHAKETYVQFGCAYCHGLTLTPRGEAADLMHSPLVGVDIDGSTIVPLLRAGIPRTAKLSPMPQFSDLSEQQLLAIARYIHYARQQGHLREVTAAPVEAGDASAGKGLFDSRCSTCHAADLSGIGRKYDPGAMRDHMLRPARLAAAPSFKVASMDDAKLVEGRRQHDSFLENATAGQVADLVAFLSTR